MAVIVNEPDPLNKVKTILDANWLTYDNNALPKPTTYIWNEPTRPDFDLQSGDVLLISYDAGQHTERHRYHMDFRDIMINIKIDINTAISRQRMLNLMGEIRRIVNLYRKSNSTTGYHRWRHKGWQEAEEGNMNVWVGRVLCSFESNGIALPVGVGA